MNNRMRAKALQISRSLGTRAAAGYLRNQGVTLRLALYTLLGIHYERTVYDEFGNQVLGNPAPIEVPFCDERGLGRRTHLVIGRPAPILH